MNARASKCDPTASAETDAVQPAAGDQVKAIFDAAMREHDRQGYLASELVDAAPSLCAMLPDDLLEIITFYVTDLPAAGWERARTHSVNASECRTYYVNVLTQEVSYDLPLKPAMAPAPDRPRTKAVVVPQCVLSPDRIVAAARAKADVRQALLTEGETVYCRGGDDGDSVFVKGNELENGAQGVVTRRYAAGENEVRAYQQRMREYQAFLQWCTDQDMVGGAAGVWTGPTPSKPAAPKSDLVVRFQGTDRDLLLRDLLPFLDYLSRTPP